MDQQQSVTTKYTWWGGSNPPPEHLKTKRQLSEMGLSPVKAVAVIPTDKYDCLLYDPGDETSVKLKRKCSPAQLAALERARNKSHFRRLWRYYSLGDGLIERDRVDAVEWARTQINTPNTLILDTETTGLASDAQMIEISVIDMQGQVLMDSLCKPVGKWRMEEGAIATHGIQPDDLAEAPSFAELHPQIKQLLHGNRVLMYGADIDVQVIKTGCELAEVSPIEYNHTCLMLWYSQWVGDWSIYWESYRWQALGGGHRALADCRVALERLKEMAEDSNEIVYPNWLLEAANKAGIELRNENSRFKIL